MAIIERSLLHPVMYATFNDAYPSIVKHVIKNGDENSPRGMLQREVMQLSYGVEDVSDPYFHPPESLDKKYCPNYVYGDAFSAFVRSGKSEMPTELKELSKGPKDFDWRTEENYAAFEAMGLPPNTNFFYSARIAEQVPHIVEELKADRDSRRATVSILYGGTDNQILSGLRDGSITKLEYPCLVSVSFLIRNDKLHCSTMYRSQNMAGVFPYDFNIISGLMKDLQAALGDVDLGNFYSSVWSAHIYARDYERANAIVESCI